MDTQKIIDKLPYSAPFLFVDELLHIDEHGAKGTFTFDEGLDFYQGHFKEHPVTPGVILTETMAQIGVVCLGIYLTMQEGQLDPFFLTGTRIDFMRPVYPGETVTVISQKVYYRFGKLKCEVKMLNSKDEKVCEGTIEGMKTKNA